MYSVVFAYYNTMKNMSKDYSKLDKRAIKIVKYLPNIKNYHVARFFCRFSLYKSKNKKFVHVIKEKIYIDGFFVKYRHYSKNLGINKKLEKSIIVFFHGGGFLYGHLNSSNGALIDLCNRIDTDIFAPTYPFAPKYKFYSQMDVCKKFVDKIIKMYPNRKLLFIGESAGGNIALNLALDFKNTIVRCEYKQNCEKNNEEFLKNDKSNLVLHNKELKKFCVEKKEKLVCGCVLLYPFVHMVDRNSYFIYPSLKKYNSGFFLSYFALQIMSKLYLPKYLDIDNINASPILRDFTDIADTQIFYVEHDPLCDQSIRLYEKIKKFNKNSSIEKYSSTIHGYFNMFEEHIKSTIEKIAIKFF